MIQPEIARMTFRATSIVHGAALELSERLKTADLDEEQLGHALAVVRSMETAIEALGNLMQALHPGEYQKVFPATRDAN